MPISDPRDRFFYPTLTLMMDSYILQPLSTNDIIILSLPLAMVEISVYIPPVLAQHKAIYQQDLTVGTEPGCWVALGWDHAEG